MTKHRHKMLLVDVDGTLIAKGRTKATLSIKQLLRRLQADGVKVAIATGRCYPALPSVLSDFTADYYLCHNGACVFDQNVQPLFEQPLALEWVDKIRELCNACAVSYGFAFHDGYHTYRNHQFFADFYAQYNDDISFVKNGEDQTRHLQTLPFSAWGILNPQDARRLEAENPEVRVTLFGENSYDICRTGVNKGETLRWLAGHLGLALAHTVAIGDGGNDVEMLAAAGIGVAMGNAPWEVRKSADMVTATALENGAEKAILKIFYGEE